jgi:hypothetical protein
MPICFGPTQPALQFPINTRQDFTQLTLKRQGFAPLLTKFGGSYSRNPLQATAP